MKAGRAMQVIGFALAGLGVTVFLAMSVIDIGWIGTAVAVAIALLICGLILGGMELVCRSKDRSQ